MKPKLAKPSASPNPPKSLSLGVQAVGPVPQHDSFHPILTLWDEKFNCSRAPLTLHSTDCAAKACASRRFRTEAARNLFGALQW